MQYCKTTISDFAIFNEKNLGENQGWALGKGLNLVGKKKYMILARLEKCNSWKLARLSSWSSKQESWISSAAREVLTELASEIIVEATVGATDELMSGSCVGFEWTEGNRCLSWSSNNQVLLIAKRSTWCKMLSRVELIGEPVACKYKKTAFNDS